MSLDMNIELCFFSCALESNLGQRLNTIKVELELELRIVTDSASHLIFDIMTETYTLYITSLIFLP